MPYAKGHKLRTRHRILECGRRLFMQQGYQRTSIEQIMAASGLTRGAFYAHFDSKQELYAKAMERGTDCASQPNAWAWELLDHFVDLEALSGEDGFTPLTSLAADADTDSPALRAVRTKLLQRTLNSLHAHKTPADSTSDNALLALTAMTVGTEVIARTTSDKQLTRRIQDACREVAEALHTDATHTTAPAYLWDTTVLASPHL